MVSPRSNETNRSPHSLLRILIAASPEVATSNRRVIESYIGHDPAITDLLKKMLRNSREIKELIPDYLQACLEKEIYRVRIIHGKGTGSLRRTVHALLDRETCVSSYRLADESAGSWGATMVVLHPHDKDI